MSKKRLIKGFLLQSDNSSIVKEIMMSPRDEKFVNTLLYQRITLNMYIDAYRFNHGITNDENLPDYLQELIRIYKLFDLCIKQLPYDGIMHISPSKNGGKQGRPHTFYYTQTQQQKLNIC